MKPDRFASPLRSAALGLAGVLLLLLAPGPAASGQFSIRSSGLGFSVQLRRGSKTAKVAAALAKEMAAVHQRFEQSRRSLPVVKGPGGAPAYPLQSVVDLVDSTERDLVQGIERTQERKLDGLHAWASQEIRRIRGELEPAPAVRTAVWSSDPQAVAVVASLGAYALPGAALAKSAPAQPATVGAERAGQILDQVGQVIGQLFFLAKNDDLEVQLWVGSTPAKGARFSFWPQASAKASPATPAIIQTDGKRDHVMRGLYAFKVSFSVSAVGGSVVESFQGGPGHPGEHRDTEGLDLVNGSSFFCCSFEDKYCHHVDSEKDCRAGRR